MRYGNDSDAGNELYDLSNDLGETNNLVEQNPDVAKRLAAALEKAEINGRTR